MKSLILFLTLLLCFATALADKDKCENGHGGNKKCTDSVCQCAGNPDGSMRKEGEPDNPKNKQYPRYVCLQACTKECCSCTVKKEPKRDNSYEGSASQRPRDIFFAGKHEASAHVTRAGGKPAFCAACSAKKSEKKK